MRRNRILSVLLGLSTIGIASCSSREGEVHTMDSPTDCHGKHSRIISVDSNGNPDCQDARISKGRGDVIIWRSTSGKSIEIVFTTPPGSPFDSVDCSAKTVCFSNRITADYGPYGYTVTVDGQSKADPNVIIDK